MYNKSYVLYILCFPLGIYKGNIFKEWQDLRSEEQWQSFYCVGIQRHFRMLLQEMTRKMFGNSKMWLGIDSLPKNQLHLSFISWWLLKKKFPISLCFMVISEEWVITYHMFIHIQGWYLILPYLKEKKNCF